MSFFIDAHAQSPVLVLSATVSSAKLVLPRGRWRLILVPSADFTGTPLAFVRFSADTDASNKAMDLPAPGLSGSVMGAPLAVPYPLELTVCEVDRDAVLVSSVATIQAAQTLTVIASPLSPSAPRGCT